jgi:hypothetical protein
VSPCGAVGLGVQYGMLDSYGLGAAATASAIAIVGVFNLFATQALAADLVWRAASWVPQVLVGALTFLWWRVTAARRRRRVTAEHGPSERPV